MSFLVFYFNLNIDFEIKYNLKKKIEQLLKKKASIAQTDLLVPFEKPKGTC